MLEPTLAFIIKYKYIFIFYLLVILFFFIKRKQLDYQAKIIVLYRMKFGLRFIEKVATKFREWIILLGYIGVGVGYLGLILISYVLIKTLYDLVTVPAAVSGVSLVLPGINVPGVGILPFWHWLIAIFVIALVHEFSHGIVARAHNIGVKNTGIVLLGPIIGAFVEPEEKKLVKEKDIRQYSVYAAGPFSNIILAIIALLMINLIFFPIQQNMVEPTGFSFGSFYSQDFSIAQSGIVPGAVVAGIDGQPTPDFSRISEILNCLPPGKEISIETKEESYSFKLGSNPENPEKSFMGITQVKNEFEVKNKYLSGRGRVWYWLVSQINEFLKWVFILSLGIGLFNLLPLPIVDGGRMMQVTMHKFHGRKKGERRYRQIGMLFLLILLLSLIYPFLMKLF